MPTLAKGANIPVDGQSVKAVLSWETNFANDSIDISALLLTESGRVRDDDDFIFYNQPQHRSGAVAHLGRVTNARVAETLDVQFDRIDGDNSNSVRRLDSPRRLLGRPQHSTRPGITWCRFDRVPHRGLHDRGSSGLR